MKNAPHFAVASVAFLAALGAAWAQSQGQGQGQAARPAYTESTFASAASYAEKLMTPNAQGLAQQNLPHSPGTTVAVLRRAATGLADVHGTWNEQFVFISGSAVMHVGGELVNGKETGPNERRGDSIKGGKTYQVGAGDTVWVRAGDAHHLVVPAGGEIRYYTFKDQTK